MTSTIRIGELAQRTGLSIQTIRYYETIGLLPPASRTSSGYRCFPPETAEHLLLVKNLQVVGLSLAAIRELMRPADHDSAHCGKVRRVLRRQLEALRLTVVRSQLLVEHIKGILRNRCAGRCRIHRPSACRLLSELTRAPGMGRRAPARHAADSPLSSLLPAFRVSSTLRRLS